MITINNPTVHRIDTLVDGKKLSILPKTNNQQFDISGSSAEKLKERLTTRFPAVNFGSKKEATKPEQETAKPQPDLIDSAATKPEQANKSSKK